MRERTDVYAYKEPDGVYVVEWAGNRYAADNPFGLDSKLTEGGVPMPRNLRLVDREEARRRNR